MSARPEPADRRPRVLVVEDEDVLSALLARVLGDEGYQVETVRSGEDALERLARELFDLVLLDLNLPGIGGMEVLGAAPTLQTDARFVVMTAFGSVDTAVEAMKLGAFDYVAKPFRPEELLLTVERAAREREAMGGAPRPGAEARHGAWEGVVGDSAPMRRVMELVERVAPMRATVLITGETGTGKELVARAVHRLSSRARGPFVPVNCSALPESLLESELFGHTRGSFTGAVADKPGLFEEADGGTLFLDEISTISPATQVKLLRALQEKQVKRIGGRKQIPVDFRLVAAANVPLEQEVAAGRFRADLHYRLNVFPVRVPPLRERRGDVPLLARWFRERFARENDVPCPDFTPETLARMKAHDWPGNVRELENFVERAMIMHAGAAHVPFEPPEPAHPSAGETVLERADGEGWSLERLEREYVVRALRRAGGCRSDAAGTLGVHPRTLTRRLRRWADEGVLPADLAEETR